MAETTLFEVGVLFLAAALAGLGAKRIGQSVIPFYILIGMLLSPYVLGRLPSALEEGATIAGYTVLPAVGTLTVGDYDIVAALAGLAIDGNAEFVHLGAELGIVFLLFFLGLEFNMERLLAARDRIGKAGTIDLLNFVVGLALGWYFFGEFIAAFFIAGIVYISSSAIITKSLIDLGWIANDEANPMLGILVYEDLFIAVYLAVASAIVVGGNGVADAAQSVSVGMAFIVVVLLFVYLGTEYFQAVLDDTSNEFKVLRVLGITVLVAGAALGLGVSEAVAAFFVGMGFSSTDHVHDLEQLLEPLRDAFAAIFFLWIGLLTDPLLFGPVLGMIAFAVVVTTISKQFTAYWGGRVYELDERRSLRVALGMTTRGEFSLIAASIAITVTSPEVQGAISAEVAQTIYAFAVGYVLFMSILGTTLMQYSDRIEAVVVPRLTSSESKVQTVGD